MNSDDRDSRKERESQGSPPSETSEPEAAPAAPESRDGEEHAADDGVTAAPADKPEDGGPTPNGADQRPDDPSGGDPASAPETAGASEGSESAPAGPPATYYDDPYEEDYAGGEKSTAVAKSEPAPKGAPPAPPPPPSGPTDDLGDEEEGMARMSFLEHLEELRTRIIRSLGGLVVAYAGCLLFAKLLFAWIRNPFDRAVAALPHEVEPQLVALTPIEGFHLLYLKLPLLAAVFVASPWLMYQAWAFIAPGLYKRERRWAGPFVLSTAGLFILGGVFGYFVALRFALAFLVGINQDLGVQPMIGIASYFDTFVGIMLGLGVVFQMPILIFFLTLLRIFTPGFLLSNVRYAILLIFVLAAVITPTPDVFNMILFAAPMILLFYIGIGASYLLVLKREKRTIPWRRILLIVLAVVALIAGVIYYMHAELGFQFVREAPFFIRPVR